MVENYVIFIHCRQGLPVQGKGNSTARISPIHREVLVLRDYQDLSYSEIAKTLRIPQGTVMSRLHRARMLIRTTVNRRVATAREDSDE